MSIKFDFSDKIVLITGSSSGIGEAIAKRFAEYNANVVITGRSRENVKRVADECQRLSPKNLKPLKVIADLTNDNDCKLLLRTIIDYFGRLDILINNAGYAQFTALLDDYENSLKNFDNIWRLDVRSVINLTLMSIPYLQKTQGNIINISSIVSMKPLPGFYGYCMSKSAIDMFTRVCALELGPKGIRVNCINPGGIRTNFLSSIGMNQQQILEQEKFLCSSSPIGIMGEPMDIANIVLYVSSDLSKFMTGTCLLIDGGTLYSSLTLTQLS